MLSTKSLRWFFCWQSCVLVGHYYCTILRGRKHLLTVDNDGTAADLIGNLTVHPIAIPAHRPNPNRLNLNSYYFNKHGHPNPKPDPKPDPKPNSAKPGQKRAAAPRLCVDREVSGSYAPASGSADHSIPPRPIGGNPGYYGGVLANKREVWPRTGG